MTSTSADECVILSCDYAGDGCRRDEDGFYWITGRVDDVINVSGHRVGTAEVESALTAHDMCAEAAVIG
jgi:acetyl-CoA synthetase